jgi:hypothetical protein
MAHSCATAARGTATSRLGGDPVATPVDRGEPRRGFGGIVPDIEWKETPMAIGLRIKFPGGTQEQYIAVHDHLDIENRPPHGLIFHVSGPVEGGWGVLDFWHSRNYFDQFVQGRLKHALDELGGKAFPAPPEIKEFPIHNYTVPRI